MLRYIWCSCYSPVNSLQVGCNVTVSKKKNIYIYIYTQAVSTCVKKRPQILYLWIWVRPTTSWKKKLHKLYQLINLCEERSQIPCLWIWVSFTKKKYISGITLCKKDNLCKTYHRSFAYVCGYMLVPQQPHPHVPNLTPKLKGLSYGHNLHSLFELKMPNIDCKHIYGIYIYMSIPFSIHSPFPQFLSKLYDIEYENRRKGKQNQKNEHNIITIPTFTILSQLIVIDLMISFELIVITKKISSCDHMAVHIYFIYMNNWIYTS